jgi:hypothetical protein
MHSIGNGLGLKWTGGPTTKSSNGGVYNRANSGERAKSIKLLDQYYRWVNAPRVSMYTCRSSTLQSLLGAIRVLPGVV